MRWKTWLNVVVFCLVISTCVPAAEVNSALAVALDSITAERLSEHTETLAGDSFEGREAGRRGGRAAGNYIMQKLRRAELKPAGQAGTYFQSFGAGYRNILASVPGDDPELSSELILVTSHYDHVGYGNRRNSNGPVGYIHNGADDNASGVASLLELAKALKAYEPGVRRSVLFVFWDAEEKGLLGSKYWLRHPGVDLRKIRLMVNLDMVGRLRDERVSLIGTRSLAGLRSAWSRANANNQLHLEFPWQLVDNSDHFPFFQRRIPITMVHTGLHDDYHRPSDDPHRLNVNGMEQIGGLVLSFLVEVANGDQLPAFRSASTRENAAAQANYERSVSERPMRLGVSWESRPSAGGMLVRSVWAGSAADRVGIKSGDLIVGLDGQQPVDAAQLRRAVVTSPKSIELEIQRDGDKKLLRVELDGSPARVGISWRTNDAEPNVVMLSSVLAGSPASVAGLKRLDRVHTVAGQPIESSNHFHAMMIEAKGDVEVLIERDGQMRAVTLQLPDA